MKIAASESRTIDELPLDQIRVAQIIGAAVKRLGYSDISLVLDQLQISAIQNDVERRVSHTFQYLYDLFIFWLPNSGKTTITVEVTERRSSWQKQACQKKVAEIFVEIERAAQRFNQAKQHIPASTIFGDGRFASAEEIEKRAPQGNEKFYLGSVENQEVAVKEELSHRHTLVCGPTGSGKTWSVFIPNLILKPDTSMIVTEARSAAEDGHLYHYSAGFRSSKGQKIFHFDPEHKWSTRVNPVEQAKDPLMGTYIASLIMENTSLDSHSGDQIWETSERLLLTALLLDANVRGEHLGNIRWSLRRGPVGMGEKLLNSPSKVARAEYYSFLNNSLEGFRAGVVAGLMQRLNLWIIPEIVALTETSDFTPEELQNELFTFYLSTPAEKAQYTPLMSLVFNYIFSVSLAKAKRNHPMMLLLDEFINFGRIPNMAKKLTMIRHSHVGAVLGIQDYIQLDELYGEKRAKIIFGQPATRVFFKPNDFRTAEEIAKLLGKKTAEDVTINSRCEVFSRRMERWLLTPQELLGLDEGKIIARVPDLKYPLLIDRIPMQLIEDKVKITPPSVAEHPVCEKHYGTDSDLVNWQDKAADQTRWWNSLTIQEKLAIFEREKKRKWAQKQTNNEETVKPNSQELPPETTGHTNVGEFPSEF